MEAISELNKPQDVSVEAVVVVDSGDEDLPDTTRMVVDEEATEGVVVAGEVTATNVESPVISL